MSKRRLFLGLLLLLMMLSGCSSNPERYMISIHQIDIANGREGPDLAAVTDEINQLLEPVAGQWALPPVKLNGDMNNPGSPEYAASLGGHYAVLTRFADKKQAQAYTDALSQKMAESNSVLAATTQIAFTSKVFKPMPTMPDFPVISLESLEYEDSGGIIMINAIDMKNPLLNPLMLPRMLRYTARNTPALEAYGTNLFASFKVLDVVRGEFPFEAIFLTEWRSREACVAFHQQEDFLTMAKNWRNPSFEGFIESEGVVVDH